MSYYNVCRLRCPEFFKSSTPVYNGGLKVEHVINHCEIFSILVKTLKKTLGDIWAHHQPHTHCCSSSTLSAASFSVTVYYQPISFTQNLGLILFHPLADLKFQRLIKSSNLWEIYPTSSIWFPSKRHAGDREAVQVPDLDLGFVLSTWVSGGLWRRDAAERGGDERWWGWSWWWAQMALGVFLNIVLGF